jgi:hypothetical protein
VTGNSTLLDDVILSEGRTLLGDGSFFCSPRWEILLADTGIDLHVTRSCRFVFCQLNEQIIENILTLILIGLSVFNRSSIF